MVKPAIYKGSYHLLSVKLEPMEIKTPSGFNGKTLDFTLGFIIKSRGNKFYIGKNFSFESKTVKRLTFLILNQDKCSEWARGGRLSVHEPCGKSSNPVEWSFEKNVIKY